MIELITPVLSLYTLEPREWDTMTEPLAPRVTPFKQRAAPVTGHWTALVPNEVYLMTSLPMVTTPCETKPVTLTTGNSQYFCAPGAVQLLLPCADVPMVCASAVVASPDAPSATEKTMLPKMKTKAQKANSL